MRRNSRGNVVEQRKIAIIQLSYFDEGDEGEEPMTYVLQVSNFQNKRLPRELQDLLLETRGVTFVGRAVEGDFKKISKDFKWSEVSRRALYNKKCIDLARMAKDRGVVQTANVGLGALVAVCLKETLDKNPKVRLGKWESADLNPNMVEYAALDTSKALEVYAKLIELPNLSTRLLPGEALVGTKVDIVPPSGSRSNYHPPCPPATPRSRRTTSRTTSGWSRSLKFLPGLLSSRI